MMCLLKEQISKWMEGIHDFQEFESASNSCTLVLYIWQKHNTLRNAWTQNVRSVPIRKRGRLRTWIHDETRVEKTSKSQNIDGK